MKAILRLYSKDISISVIASVPANDLSGKGERQMKGIKSLKKSNRKYLALLMAAVMAGAVQAAPYFV